jgi:hypothetical protein
VPQKRLAFDVDDPEDGGEAAPDGGADDVEEAGEVSPFAEGFSENLKRNFSLSPVYRVARFFLVNDTKTGKMYQMNTKCTEWS